MNRLFLLFIKSFIDLELTVAMCCNVLQQRAQVMSTSSCSSKSIKDLIKSKNQDIFAHERFFLQYSVLQCVAATHCNHERFFLRFYSVLQCVAATHCNHERFFLRFYSVLQCVAAELQ